MSVIEVRGLRKTYPAHRRQPHPLPAVDGVDLATTEGEYLVLLGPSGCGKTTLLRTIAGLETPTDGEILIGSHVVNDLPPRARRIAMVFQSYALYPHKSVRENIVFPLRAAKLAPAARAEKLSWAAELLGIAHLLDRRPRQLSGGERQRVALARALVREPSVFLLDEPLSNLDAKLRASARDELRSFQADIGITTIYVTHDQVEAMGLGDRIAVMDQGRIRQIGPPMTVYDDPADTFVATFIGSPPMNLLPADGGVVVGFRPEHLLPEHAVAEADRARVQFAVDRIEYLSGDRHLYGTVTGLGPAGRVIARLPATVADPVPAGGTHPFAIAAHRLRYFDAETGLRTAGTQVRTPG